MALGPQMQLFPASLADMIGGGGTGGMAQQVLPLVAAQQIPGQGTFPFASASGRGAANALASGGTDALAGGGASGLEDYGKQLQGLLEKGGVGRAATSGATKTAATDALESAAKKGLAAKILGPGSVAGLFEGMGGNGLRGLLMSGGETGALGGLGTLAGRVAVPIAGMQAASMLGHAFTLGQHKGSWDEGAEGALTGATGGALAGSMIAPGVGTVIGGVLGGLGGGALGLFGPKSTGEKAAASETAKQSAKLNKLLTQFGADSDTRKQLAAQFQFAVSGAKSKKEVQAGYGQFTSNPALLETISDAKRRKASMAAVQAWMGPAMEKALASEQFYANAQGDAFDRIASQYTDPNQAATTRAYGALSRASAAERGAAMMQQLAAAQQLAGQGLQTGQNSDGTTATDLQSLLAAQPVAGS